MQRIAVGRRVVHHGAGTRLHRAGGYPAHFHPELRHVRGAGERGLDRGRIPGLAFERQVAGHVVVELRRAGRKRRLGRDDRRQVPVLDLDQLGGVLRRVGQTEASVDLARLAGLPAAVLRRAREMRPLVDTVDFLLRNPSVNGVNLNVDGGWLLR